LKLGKGKFTQRGKLMRCTSVYVRPFVAYVSEQCSAVQRNAARLIDWLNSQQQNLIYALIFVDSSSALLRGSWKKSPGGPRTRRLFWLANFLTSSACSLSTLSSSGRA
jgi:hypothetical protein